MTEPRQSDAGRFEALWQDVTTHVASRGIEVQARPMAPDTPAAFDGLSIALNPSHDRPSLCWYLVHSYGSIVAWSLDLFGTREMFHELREAKCDSAAPPDRLERAIARFRAFEELASSYSVQVLADLGHAWAVAPFTLFFRADLEAMTIFHRQGRAPVWREFLDRWIDESGRGTRVVEPFEPVVVPPFTPARFEIQQVKQEIGER